MKLNNWKILLKKILPPFVIFLIVVIAFWFFAIPFMENHLINAKKETVRQLSNTMWHLMDDYHQKVKDHELTEKKAKEKVKEHIKSLRYGPAGKDYFWIHDLSPRMIIHPYMPELNGNDLSNYEDPDGKKMFVKMVELCQEKGSGFVDYQWQWKDEPGKLVPKISYVKLFVPWGWIIGTGIYINDVHNKIDQITSRMNIVFAVLGLLVLLTSFLISMNSIKTEYRLRESRAKFRELFNMAPDPAFLLSKEGVFIEVNKAVKEKTGYEEKELIGLSLKNSIPFLPEKSREIALNNLKKRLSGEQVSPYSFEAVTKDNKILIFEINVRSIEKEGRLTGLIVIARDITERKLAEKELQVKNRISNSFINAEHEHFYKEVLEVLRGFFVSEYGFFGYINEGGDFVAESMTRDVWDECQIQDKSIIFPRDKWGGLWGDSLKEKKTLYQNGNMQFPQGHVQLQNAIAAPIVVNDKLIGQIALANKQGGFNKSDKQEINNLCDYIAPLLHSKFKEDKYKQELLEAKEKAERSEERYQTFIEQSAEGIYRLEMEQAMDINIPVEDQIEFIYDHAYIAECNQKYAQMYGKSSVEDLKDVRLVDLHGGRNNPVNRDVIKGFIENGYRIEDKETQEFNDHGDIIYIANNTIGITESGKLTRLWGTQADITHRKIMEKNLLEAKEKAEESDQLKSAFLANMSHEIRTPMNGILGFAKMLQEREFSKEKQDKFLGIIHSRTGHLLNIINDLVDVSKIESNQLKINFQQFCLNDLMKELYRVYKNQLNTLEKSHIEFKVNASLDHENSFIYSDPSRFRQIMDNLLNNAIKFTHEGSIEFGYELTSKGELLFYVKDTGIGIPGNQQENIFERFRQAEGTTSNSHEGTGLGLTISRNLVELLGGQMWVESNEGEGTVFYFTLPYESQEKTEKEEEKKEVVDETKGEDKTLLIIEDDHTSLEYIKELLKPSGFNIIACTTGKEGYEAFLNHPEIDLILMDIKLPDTTGLELTRKIRSSAHHSDVHIIAQTAYAMSEDAQKSKDAGCDDYISKPIDQNKLLAIIHKLI